MALFLIGDAGCLTTHFTFENLMEGGVIYDTSNNANYGTIQGEATLDEKGKFGKCLHLSKNSNVSLGSQTFHNRPSSAITVALWVKLASTAGVHEMFHTCKSYTPDGKEQFNFEVKDGKVGWFHRDHMERTVFKVKSGIKKMIYMFKMIYMHVNTIRITCFIFYRKHCFSHGLDSHRWHISYINQGNQNLHQRRKFSS